MTAFSDKSESICALAKAVTKAYGELSDVVKTQTAKAGAYSYSYATIADALGMARPILSKHGLAVMQTAECTSEDVVVHTTVMHESGEYITHMPTRLAAGADAQKTGSAITYARRYSLMAALGLATEDDDGASAPSRRSPVPKAAPKPSAPPQPAKPGFRSADKLDGLSNDERTNLLRIINDLRMTNDVTKDFTVRALNEADAELLSDLSDEDLMKLRKALT
ncbi:MAG: hypothetical protein EOM68_22015, partial [Spirochaetia bacterium]|nr:hypothetical protein [Spirochaetia bacterium]